MNPPMVNELTSPRAQSTRRIRAIVQSMVASCGRAFTTVVPTPDLPGRRAIPHTASGPPALPTPDSPPAEVPDLGTLAWPQTGFGPRDASRHGGCIGQAGEMHNTAQNIELPEFSPGTILQGTYRIVGPIAEGGCGEIFLADHTRLPGQVAIKVLHRGLEQNAEVLSRFRQEAEITATLSHPHIVQVLDFNVTDQGYPYLVMELLAGQSLASRINDPDAPALAPTAVVDIVEQIAQ